MDETVGRIFSDYADRAFLEAIDALMTLAVTHRRMENKKAERATLDIVCYAFEEMCNAASDAIEVRMFEKWEREQGETT
ncbi:hypothetical protein [Tunturiibacter gelidoferens]|uniref:Uncharacterized protein n=1 Tax=Tunturiibacter gelidiferens TaxID=3069689 RepID=A0A9X0QK80_9BACT|nr:hypothetical protein [Edaphobacter lichenicola]MBB5331880.1 hypothetical protein [Edaphobacter lichenicola]